MDQRSESWMARDMWPALIAGLISGALAIPILVNLGIDVRIPLICLPFISAALFAAAIFTAHRVTRSAPSLFQFAKFAAIGSLNFTVDFGVLNLLMLMTGVVAGMQFLALKSASVSLAVVNSYLWNKYWTFEAHRSDDPRREFAAFLVVTLTGIALNVAAAHVVVNVIGAPRGVSLKLWANFGAFSAAGITLFTNFFGYKFLVFKRPLVDT